jgi:hypothetical protein
MLWAMPELTHRRSSDPHGESSSVYCDDVRVGTIGRRAGVPVEVDQWGWSCGFYPGLEPDNIDPALHSPSIRRARISRRHGPACSRRFRPARSTDIAVTASTELGFHARG